MCRLFFSTYGTFHNFLRRSTTFVSSSRQSIFLKIFVIFQHSFIAVTTDPRNAFFFVLTGRTTQCFSVKTICFVEIVVVGLKKETKDKQRQTEKQNETQFSRPHSNKNKTAAHKPAAHTKTNTQNQHTQPTLTCMIKAQFNQAIGCVGLVTHDQ